MKEILFSLLLLLGLQVFAQTPPAKKPISDSERILLQDMAAEMCRTDQLYRNVLAKGTTDETMLARIDSVYDKEGIEAGIKYERSLQLELPKAVQDSLWDLQHALDLSNHLKLRGLIEAYGWLPKEILGESQYIQTLILLHPPKDWDVPAYLKAYSTLLRKEVDCGRMPAMAYASFYDNMKAKILREAQLFGTNQQFDPKSGTILPPIIRDLEETNSARAEIGLPHLEEGEYRLSDDLK